MEKSLTFITNVQSLQVCQRSVILPFYLIKSTKWQLKSPTLEKKPLVTFQGQQQASFLYANLGFLTDNLPHE